MSAGFLDLPAGGPAELDFWLWPRAERDAAFARLRKLDRPAFFPEPDYGEFGFPPGDGYYAVTRYAEVAEVSRTPRVFSSVPSVTTTYDLPEQIAEYLGSMLMMDDPRHARLRRIVARAFTARTVRETARRVEAAATMAVARLAERGPGDFVETATRVPTTVICEMLGIPASRADFVAERTNLINGAFDPEFVPDRADILTTQAGAAEELRELVLDLGAQRLRRPQDDLVSALVTANVDGERLTLQELASFFIVLVLGGSETTRHALSHALVLLTDHPDQRSLWLSDFDRYAPTAVEEILRVASPVTFMRRTVTRDHRLGTLRVHEGDKVLVFYGSANQDDAVFTDPGAFDITRRPNPHVAFGAPGPHYCLGAHLTRLELTVTLRELLHRLPGLRAAGEPEPLRCNLVNGIKHLPCTF
jgi:methyl-branched lipid omega-hydroxylase